MASIICLLEVYGFSADCLAANNIVISDAVILFVGPELNKRQAKAKEIIEKGYAKVLIIPAYNKIVSLVGKEKEEKITTGVLEGKVYPNYYQNTHIEILQAKAMMDNAGLRSAILVSSPWHIRRIKIMASKVFERETYQIQCIGSHFPQKGSFPLYLTWSEIRHIGMEYLKIIVFFFYQLAMV